MSCLGEVDQLNEKHGNQVDMRKDMKRDFLDEIQRCSDLCDKKVIVIDSFYVSKELKTSISREKCN